MACSGERYLEVDVDVGSSRSAAHVVSLVSGALKSLVIDLGIVLEGRFWVSAVSGLLLCTLHRLCQVIDTRLTPRAVQDELPEQMLATVRLEHLDLTTAAHLDHDTGKITRKT